MRIKHMMILSALCLSMMATKLQQPQHGNGAGNDEKGSSHPALLCKRLGEGRQ